MYTASPVTKAGIPLYQVVRDATQQTVLVTESQERAEVSAQVLTENLASRVTHLRNAGYWLAANALLDPAMRTTHALQWTPDFLASGVWPRARLDNGWVAMVAQESPDAMFELVILKPSGALLGKPVLATSLELAKAQALGLYVRRALPELERSFQK